MAMLAVVGIRLLSHSGKPIPLTYSFTLPEANGFYRHIDKETGALPW
jgi:uncharacterized protein involved in high-affinity Fe2+ transport